MKKALCLLLLMVLIAGLFLLACSQPNLSAPAAPASTAATAKLPTALIFSAKGSASKSYVQIAALAAVAQ